MRHTSQKTEEEEEEKKRAEFSSHGETNRKHSKQSQQFKTKQKSIFQLVHRTKQQQQQRIDCNKLLMKASHGSTQCPPKVSKTATHNIECALSYSFVVFTLSLSRSACLRVNFVFVFGFTSSFGFSGNICKNRIQKQKYSVLCKHLNNFRFLRKYNCIIWWKHVKKWLKVIFRSALPHRNPINNYSQLWNMSVTIL